MNAQTHEQYEAIDISASEIRRIREKGALILLCALAALCVSALLLLTAPSTIDAAATAGTATVESVSEPVFHERYRGQFRTDWADTLDAVELATWRLRSSD